MQLSGTPIDGHPFFALPADSRSESETYQQASHGPTCHSAQRCELSNQADVSVERSTLLTY